MQSPQIVGKPDMVLKDEENGRYKIPVEKGEKVLITSKNYQGDFSIMPVKNQKGSANMYGLNKKFKEAHPHIQRYLQSPYSPELWREIEDIP